MKLFICTCGISRTLHSFGHPVQYFIHSKTQCSLCYYLCFFTIISILGIRNANFQCTLETHMGVNVCEWIEIFIFTIPSSYSTQWLTIHIFCFEFFLFFLPFLSTLHSSICSSLFIMFITTPFFMWSVSFGCFINDQKLFTSHTYQENSAQQTYIGLYGISIFMLKVIMK